MTTQLPPKDVKAIWDYLESGIERIMTNLHNGMDMKTYMGMYTAIHNFCNAQEPVRSSFAAHNKRGGAHLRGGDLYKHLEEYLEKHLQGVWARSKECVDEALLTFYIKEWNRYSVAAQYMNHLFRFLNRHWVKREIDEGKKNIYSVYTLHLVLWKKEIVTRTQNNVILLVLGLVEKQRNGETIEQSRIKSVVDSFVSLGLDDLDDSKSTLDVYKEYFEKPFLEATNQYYNKKSKQYLAEHSIAEYVKWVLAQLNEEKERVRRYLHIETMRPLMEACNEVLIARYSGAFRDDSLDSRDNEGRTPLSWAAENGNKAMVELLLDNQTVGSDSRDNEGRTPLSWAVGCGHEAVVKLLIQDMDRHNLDKFLYGEALHRAVKAGQPEMIRVLFNEAGVDINFQDTVNKSTALHLAVEKDDQHAYQVLLTLGANIDLKNGAGISALELAWLNKRIKYDAYECDQYLSDNLDSAGQATCSVLQRKPDVSISDETKHEFIFCKEFDLKYRNKSQEKVVKDIRTLLLREHNILQKLRHPNFVEYLGFIQDEKEADAKLYLEYCNGGSLHPYVKENVFGEPPTKRLDKAESWKLVFQLAAALAYLHHGLAISSSQFTFQEHWIRILHRDVKPENVVFNQSSDGYKVAKLCDLGLAKQASVALSRHRGTEDYKPPEMRTLNRPQKEWTIKGEIFSLGCTLRNLEKTDECEKELQPLIEKCMIYDPPSSRPSSLDILQEAVPHVTRTLPDLASSLHSFLNSSDGNYLLNAMLILGLWLDDQGSWYLKSTRHRRREILKRLHVLCYEDGAITVFDRKATSVHLHLAVVLNRVSKVKELLQLHKQDSAEDSRVVNTKWSNSGWTPLHLAYQRENYQETDEIKKLLEEAGANPELKDRHGLRPRECMNIGADRDPGVVENGDLLDRLLKMRVDTHC